MRIYLTHRKKVLATVLIASILIILAIIKIIDINKKCPEPSIQNEYVLGQWFSYAGMDICFQSFDIQDQSSFFEQYGRIQGYEIDLEQEPQYICIDVHVKNTQNSEKSFNLNEYCILKTDGWASYPMINDVAEEMGVYSGTGSSTVFKSNEEKEIILVYVITNTTFEDDCKDIEKQNFFVYFSLYPEITRIKVN